MTGALAAVRTETAKLARQRAPQALIAVCLLGPVLLTVGLRVQPQLPRDTLFGRWAGESGAAVPFLVLGFAQLWALPLIAGACGGDVFSAEDRQRSWETLLTRSCTRMELFAGKALAACALTTLSLAVLCCSSTASGLVAGGRDLVGLDGATVPPGRAAGLAVVSWLVVLPPLLVFTALALLLSVAVRSGVAGIGGPVLAGLVLQVVSLVDAGPLVRRLLPSTGFDAWHLLVTADPDWHPAGRALALSLAYLVALVAAAAITFRRRDFT